jgi:hypothetical protein
MIPGESWFPITGNIILKGKEPICSVPHDAHAYEIMEALIKHNKGVQYTCISNNGWYCKQVDEKLEEASISGKEDK